MKNGLERFYGLVEAFERLPTIGKKSALRLAYFIVQNDTFSGLKLANSIEDAIKYVKKCSMCGYISENEICEICLDDNRNVNTICIVQSAKDIFIIEESRSYEGKYFVMESLDDLTIVQLKKIIELNNIKYILFAITPSLANDAFILFIEDKLKKYKINFTKIAQGVPTGISLENVDILSLSKAIDGQVTV